MRRICAGGGEIGFDNPAELCYNNGKQENAAGSGAAQRKGTAAMIILGIDPGIATVGYGVVSYRSGEFRFLDCGVISTPAGLRVESRLAEIHRDLKDIIGSFAPDAVAVEELFFHSNQKTVINVSQARGVILLTAELCGARVFEYTPLQVKKAVVGYGRAEKRQIIEMTKIMLKLERAPAPDDAADALALAICHAHSATSKLSGNRIDASKKTGG